MIVILLLKRRPMYDMDSRVICIEISGDEDVGGRFGGKSGEDLGLGRGLLRAEEKCSPGAVLIGAAGLVSLQLLVVLLLVLVEVVFDF